MLNANTLTLALLASTFSAGLALNRIGRRPNTGLFIDTVTNTPFRATGVNYYYLAGFASATNRADCLSWAPAYNEADLIRQLNDIRSLGVNVIRFWAFQEMAGLNGTDFTFMDRLLRLAEPRGMYLMPVLLNQWADCQNGISPGDSFYQSSYWSTKISPKWANVYKGYAMKFLERYRTRTGIIAYQLGNELQMTTYDSLNSAFFAFAKDVAGTLKSYTSNMISFGVIGDAQAGLSTPTSGGRHLQPSMNIHNLTSIDFVTFHDYEETASWTHKATVSKAMSLRIRKPVYVTEWGTSSHGKTCAMATTIFNNKVNAYVTNGAAGFNFWDYRDGWYESKANYLAWAGGYAISADTRSCLGMAMKAKYPTVATTYPAASGSMTTTIPNGAQFSAVFNGFPQFCSAGSSKASTGSGFAWSTCN